MEKTGLEYDLEINKEVDERYHLEKATEAACKYFKEAYAKFNSWTLVAASYNMGMYGLQKNLTRQKTKVLCAYNIIHVLNVYLRGVFKKYVAFSHIFNIYYST